MNGKKMMEETEKVPGKVRYTKEQLLSARCLKEKRDLVQALLDNSKLYSLDEVEKMIERYMKGKVKGC